MKQPLRFSIFITLFLLFSTMTQAQVSVIRGRVTDDKTSEPLPYVNIGVKGQTTGTFSDSNGSYHLELP
jgi:hypothetical protein